MGPEEEEEDDDDEVGGPPVGVFNVGRGEASAASSLVDSSSREMIHHWQIIHCGTTYFEHKYSH